MTDVGARALVTIATLPKSNSLSAIFHRSLVSFVFYRASLCKVRYVFPVFSESVTLVDLVETAYVSRITRNLNTSAAFQGFLSDM